MLTKTQRDTYGRISFLTFGGLLILYFIQIFFPSIARHIPFKPGVTWIITLLIILFAIGVLVYKKLYRNSALSNRDIWIVGISAALIIGGMAFIGFYYKGIGGMFAIASMSIKDIPILSFLVP